MNRNYIELILLGAASFFLGCAHLDTTQDGSIRHPIDPEVSHTVNRSTSDSEARSSEEVVRVSHQELQPQPPGVPDLQSSVELEELDDVGASVTGVPSELSLVGIEQLAMANNPTLRQSVARVREAEGSWVQVGLYPNPVVGYTASEMGQDGQAGQQGVYLSQTIVTGNKLKLNRDAACWGIEQARWQSEAQRVRVLNDVRIRYLAALGAQNAVSIAEELQTLAEAGVKNARLKFEAKEVALPDVLQAEIQLNQVGVLLENARAQQQASRQQLANIVGIPTLPDQALKGSLDEGVYEDLQQDLLWQHVSTTNPVLEATRAEIQRAQAQLRRERVEPLPNLQTQFSVQQDAATNFTIASAQVGISLPVFDRNQGNIASAAGTLRKAIADNERLELVLRDRLAEAFRRYEFAKNQVGRYRNQILPKAEQNLELTTAGYNAGEFDFLRVLTARQTLFQTRIRFVASLTELRQSLVELDGMLLTGGLSNPENYPSSVDPSSIADVLGTP